MLLELCWSCLWKLRNISSLCSLVAFQVWRLSTRCRHSCQEISGSSVTSRLPLLAAQTPACSGDSRLRDWRLDSRLSRLPRLTAKTLSSFRKSATWWILWLPDWDIKIHREKKEMDKEVICNLMKCGKSGMTLFEAYINSYLVLSIKF